MLRRNQGIEEDIEMELAFSLALMLNRAETSPRATSITFSRDGKYLFVGNQLGQVEVWDVKTMVKTRTMSGHVVSLSCPLRAYSTSTYSKIGINSWRDMVVPSRRQRG